MLGDLAVTNPTQRPQHIGRHDQRTSLAEWLQVVCCEWVAWIAVSLSAQFAVWNLLALLHREPAPRWCLIGRRSAILCPLGCLAWTADIAAIAVCREYATGQAWSLCSHA